MAALVALAAFSIPFPLVPALAAVAGLAGRRFAPPAAHPAPAAGAPARDPAVIDDDTPPPAHAAVSARRFATVVAVGLLAWALPFAALVAAFGAASDFAAMARFFTQTALLTFGGAYAVLPYASSKRRSSSTPCAPWFPPRSEARR